MGPGQMDRRVSFDRATRVADDYGGETTTWEPLLGPVWAEFRYERGREAEQAGALTGSAMFKVRIGASPAARTIDATCRMRDERLGTAFNIREVDVVTDRASVWLMVEGGVAI